MSEVWWGSVWVSAGQVRERSMQHLRESLLTFAQLSCTLQGAATASTRARAACCRRPVAGRGW